MLREIDISRALSSVTIQPKVVNGETRTFNKFYHEIVRLLH